ncbi:hypothetical protein AC1031_008366 [Aphanomyces cochlioides]|nr:hypothetical protein AC1031_008366 [Aphanomyces cochlioides]
MALTKYDEATTLSRLAGPSFATTMSLFALSMIEMMVAGHIGTTEMTAIAFSQLLLDFSLNFITQRFDKGLNSLASQAFGVWREELPPSWTICPNGLGLLGFFGVTPASIALAQQYTHLSELWLWPRIMYQLLLVSFQTQQIFLPLVVISFTFVIVHVVLNLLLLFGVPAWGWSGYGCIGMPLAMALTMYTRLGVFLAYIMGYKQYSPLAYSSKLIDVGLPLALGRLFEDVQLQLMALMASWLGEIALDSHNCTVELYMVITSIILGLTKAGVARIGMYLGAGMPAEVNAVSNLLLEIIATLAVIIAIPAMLAFVVDIAGASSWPPNSWYFCPIKKHSHCFP